MFLWVHAKQGFDSAYNNQKFKFIKNIFKTIKSLYLIPTKIIQKAAFF